MRLTITGASGYVGTAFSFLAARRGHEITAACRIWPMHLPGSWVAYSLSDDDVPASPEGTDVVIHLAANTTSQGSVSADQEITAAGRWQVEAREVGAKFIFISSQAASELAPTPYGRIKARIERTVLAEGGIVVRLGQIYGGAELGLFGQLVRIVRALPVIPAFFPSPVIQLIHCDDAAEALLRIVERDDVQSGLFCLANPEPCKFSIFLRYLVRNYRKGPCLFLPVPSAPIRWLCGWCPETSAPRRLLSLFCLKPMPTAADLSTLGMTLRSLDDGRRRKLVREGRCLLAYIGKAQPSIGLTRRYVRAVETLRGGQQLPLSDAFLGLPSLLAVIDSPLTVPLSQRSELSWRLDAATLLLEATQQGATLYLGQARKSFNVFYALLDIGGAVISEGIWLLLGLVAALFRPYDEARQP